MSAGIERPRQAVILAGGRGTRLGTLTETRPKPMVEIHGRPFLAYLIEMLREQGFAEVLLLLGYLPDVIRDYFGDGTAMGVRVTYAVTAPDDLTLFRMRAARHRLDDRFLLMYCDNYWPLDMDRLWARYLDAGVPALTTVYANRDGYSRNTVRVDDNGLIAEFDRTRTAPGLNGIEISYAILTRALIDALPDDDLLIEEALYPRLAADGQLAAYVTEHRYYSVGSAERLPLTAAFLARAPAVIVDRDGTLTRRPPPMRYLTDPSEVDWLPGALEALRRFRAAGYRVIVASNQAGIARGQLTVERLDAIHARMRRDAEAAGGRIDAFYCCPHHWDDGCACRKPKPGLLFQAQRDFSLDLSRTWFLGDDERDLQAAAAAGARGGFVTGDRSLLAHAHELLSHDSLSRPTHTHA